METVKLNGREYQVVERNEIDVDLVRLRADLEKRGFEPATFVLRGKRGGTIVAYRSAASREFVKLY